MKIVVLSGAGISADSGIATFRGADGLWEGHRIEEVASLKGWNKNRELVLDFYNKSRTCANRRHIFTSISCSRAGQLCSRNG